jgi:hypothetical protein
VKWDINDPGHRRALETARAWGVSPSRFLGEESLVVSETTGNQTVYTRSSEWKDEDRQAAMALQDYEASLCSGCGHPLEETTDPDKEYAYKAALPIRCHYCTAAAIGQEDYKESPHSEALHFPVELREPHHDH